MGLFRNDELAHQTGMALSRHNALAFFLRVLFFVVPFMYFVDKKKDQPRNWRV